MVDCSVVDIYPPPPCPLLQMVPLNPLLSDNICARILVWIVVYVVLGLAIGVF